MPTSAHASFPQTLFCTHQASLLNASVTAKPFDHAKGGRASGAVNNAGSLFSSGSFAARVPSQVVKADSRPAVRGLQDKGAEKPAPQGTAQPAPLKKDERSGVVDTQVVRVQNPPDAPRRSQRATIWMQPRVKEAIQIIADADGLSFSETAAKGLEIYARAKIHDQEQELFEPRMRAMLRQEIRASDKRHLYFEMRNAIAAEQTRIMITNLYKRQLERDGLTQQEIEQKVDDTYQMARKNVLRMTPQLKTLLDAWWNASQDESTETRVGESDGIVANGSGDSGFYPPQ
jgi:hypothetical protein